jgi:hypothetical protein
MLKYKVYKRFLIYLIMETKYSINDIIQHKKFTDLKRKIIFIYNDSFENIKETYYQTIILGKNNYSPTPMTLDTIEKYYIKL